MRHLSLVPPLSDDAPLSERHSSYDPVKSSPVAVFGHGLGPKVYLELWDSGVAKATIDHFRNIRTIVPTPYEWDLLWQLFSLKTLHSDGSVRLFIDEGSNYHDVFRVIWNSRHDYDIDTYVETISRWITGDHQSVEGWSIVRFLGLGDVRRDFDKINILFFITEIAHQNRLLSPYTLMVDNTEVLREKPHLLEEMFDLCISAERWSRIGNPISIQVKLSTETLNWVNDQHPRLHDLLRQALR